MSRAEMPTETDLALIGAAVLGLVSATLRVGHSTPAMTLDYMTWVELLDSSDSAAPAIVRDFVTSSPNPAGPTWPSPT